MSINASDFRRALGQFATGVTVVTTRDECKCAYGLTVNAFCSVSLEPPLILVCIDNRSGAHAGFRQSGIFGVSVLKEDQESVSRRFAMSHPDKFQGMDLVTGRHGALLVPAALATLECRVVNGIGAGDHTIYVGEVLSLDVNDGRPLLYHRACYRRVDVQLSAADMDHPKPLGA
jgi:flavin reductase (DIM6/NTAB) family NADH-FMN oxidoreductase RutF